MSQPTTAPEPVRFSQAMRFWLKLGFISFGGPAGQIALLHQELVERRRWLSERRFLHALNYCMVLPGPEAQQLVTYIGWLMHRSWGGIVAGAFFVLPSLLVLMVLSWLYVTWGEVPWLAGALEGIKPAVAAIVLQAAHRMGTRTLHNKTLWSIAIASFVAIFALGVPFPLIVGLAAATGYLGSRWTGQTFEVGGGHAASRKTYGPALIDDQTPLPEHAHFSLNRLARVLWTGAALWCLPMGLLYLLAGVNHSYTQMAWFFTQAALLTFGGAYAVLPYVYQGAVNEFGWVTPGQMMDGLALGESTPGPLIMVVAFVAFIAGYGQALLGPQHTVLAGVLAACLVTWFTFLPSFVFILAGAPWVERSQGDLRLSAPLTAISAAVVGVVLNLCVFFVMHTLWPQGLDQALDKFSLALTLAATLALLYFKRSVMEVLGACALAGCTVKLLGLAMAS